MEMYCSNHSGTVYARCPDKCKGAAAPQCRITEAQSSWISVKAQQEITGFGGDALICSYCGCCYIRQGVYTRRLGMLIAGHWHSVLFPMYED
jgi:hypothetical protein